MSVPAYIFFALRNHVIDQVCYAHLRVLRTGVQPLPRGLHPHRLPPGAQLHGARLVLVAKANAAELAFLNLLLPRPVPPPSQGAWKQAFFCVTPSAARSPLPFFEDTPSRGSLAGAPRRLGIHCKATGTW